MGEENAFGSFPNHWEKIFEGTALGDLTPHVRRHSFASIGLASDASSVIHGAETFVNGGIKV